MQRGTITAIGAAVVALAMTVAQHPAADAQSPLDEAMALNARAMEIYNAGKAGAAITLAKRALAIREKALGPDHPDIGKSLNNLALPLQSQGRYARPSRCSSAPSPSVKRRWARTIPRSAPPQQPRRSYTRPKAASPRPSRSTNAPSPSEKRRCAPIIRCRHRLNNLAGLYERKAGYAEAEPLYKRALAMREKALGPEGHPESAPPSTTSLCSTKPRPLRRGRAALHARPRDP